MMKRRFVPLLSVWLLVFSFWFLVSGSMAKKQRAEANNLKQELAPQAVSLVINEYLADPPAGSAGDANGDGTRDAAQDEFVEVVNTSSTPLNVGGFTISDSTQIRFTFPAGTTIPGGEASVVFGGGSPMGSFGNAAANGLVFKTGSGGLSLNNGGDTITIKDNSSATIATLTYSAVEGGAHQSITRSPDITGAFVTHSSAAGSGGTLFSPGARVNGSPFTTTDPVINSISPDAAIAGSGPVALTVTGQNFQNGSRIRVDGSPLTTTFFDSTQLGAELPDSVTNSPGAHSITVQNPDLTVSNALTFTVLGAVGINEFLADPPDGPSGDANGDGVRDSSQDEFIEIINRSDAPFNIGGFAVRDADAVRFTFPGGTIIPAGEVAVIFGGGHPQGDFGNARFNGLVFTAALSLNNTGDTITLLSGGSPVESITYGATEGSANQSINRNPDATGTTFAPHASINGSGGRPFSPGVQVNGAAFTVGPRITEIAPDRVPQNSPPFDLIVRGSGFDGDSTVFIDFAPVSSIIAGSDLIAHVPASVTAASGPHTVLVINENGNRSNALTLTVIPPPPAIEILLPRFVQAGSGDLTLIVLGKNFDAAASVLVEGSPVATMFTSAGQLKATVPASVAATIGTRRVRVRNGDGQESNDFPLEIIPATTRITRISPAQVIAGNPGFKLTVTGANFKSGAVVMFDGSALDTSFISSTELLADIPASLVATPGSHGIIEFNSDGGGSNEVVFNVFPDPPVVFSIDPAGVIEGSGDITITITGDKFQRGASVRVIENNQASARLDTKFITSQRLEALLPAAFVQTAGAVLIRVENPDLGASGNARLKVLIRDPLVINEYLADPPDDLSGDANGDGSRSSSQDEFIEIVNRTGEPIDISGYTLSDADEIRHVFATGTIIPPFEAAVVFGGGAPAGRFGNAAENHLVFKASSGGLSLNNGGDTIKLRDAAGRILQEIKFTAAEGGANQSINRDPDIDGAVFTLHTRVAEDESHLFSPGAKANGAAFTVKPAILALAPASVRIRSAEFTLIVTGSDFLPGAAVIFNQSELATVFHSSSELQARVRSELIGEGGAVEVRARNPKGELSSPAKFLITDDPPRLVTINPQKVGTGAENVEIAIAGERFQRGAVAMIASEKLETRFVSSSSLVAVAPAKFFNRASELEIRVLNADGNQSNALTLAVENGPLITRLSRARIKAGRGAVELTIGGVAFKPNAVIYVNDRAVATSFVSDNELTARIPAEMTAAPGVLTIQARHSDGGRSNKAQVKVVE